MKRMRLGVILSLLVVLGLFGCSNGDNEGSNGSSGKSDEEITLEFFTWINEENGNWDKTVKAFEEEHPGINVNVNVLVENMDGNAGLQKLDLMASSGDKLDVMMFGNIQDIAKRASAGMITPLNSFIEKENLNLEEEYNMSAVPPTKDGEYHALPTKLNAYAVMINKDHFEEAGLSIPTDWTWDDYKEYAKELTTEDRFGSYLHTWATMHHIVKMLGKPEENLLIKEDGSSNMNDPILKESLELRYELEQIDKSSEPYANIISQQMDYRQQFFTEKVSMVPIPSYMVTEWGGYDPDFNIAFAPWPKNTEDQEESYTFYSADMMAIGESSEHKEEAYEFIRWMTTEGMLVQNKYTPSWLNVDMNEVISDILKDTSNPEAVDAESLAYVLEKTVPAQQFVPAEYMVEVVNNVFNPEVELYLLDEQDIDTTIENINKKVEEFIESNQ